MNSKTIRFGDTEQSSFLRNGYSRTIALWLQDCLSEVRFKAVNTKGFATTGHIAVPRDPATLREVAQKLMELAEEIECKCEK